MSTTILDKNGEFQEIDLLNDIFRAEEGVIEQYYGRVGQGKTYNATSDILHDLSKGKVVYCNWRIQWDGFDERTSLKRILYGLFGLDNTFYKYDPKNLHYIEIDDEFIERFEKLTDCKVYLDEGHLIFDSYQMAKLSLRKRAAILHTRHFNRTLAIISQRPTAVHVSARANVNRFYKCERIMKWPFLIFRRSEYQDMADETVDETVKPVSTKWYFANKRVLNAYDTKYLRGDTPPSQPLYVEKYVLSYPDRLRLLLLKISPIRYFVSKNWSKKRALKRALQNEIVDNSMAKLVQRETIHMSSRAMQDTGKRVKVPITSIKRGEAVPIVPTPDNEQIQALF